MSTSNALTFIPLHDDPDPTIPDKLLLAILNVTKRDGKEKDKPPLDKNAKKFAKPYAHRAKELLYPEGA